MNLFLDKELTFEKLGFEARLSEDPNDWPQQILDELFQQAPYISDYAPKVVLRTVDADRRYGLGQIELFNKMAINPRDDSTPSALKGSQKALIPVIIQDGKLKPLDLLMHDGKVEPLTDERLRKALFRPNLFEAIRERPGDMSLIEQLYPPSRQYGGARGPLVSDVGSSGVSKMGSAKADFLLDAILPTVSQEDIDHLAEKLASDASLRAALLSNPSTKSIIAKLAEATPATPKKGEGLSKIAHTIKPNVIQIQKLGSMFRIKTANTEALIPDANDVSRPAAVGALGGDMVSKVESDGTTTITSQPAVKESLENMDIEVVSQFGIYKVRTLEDNRELVGWVFPKVMALDGTLLPIAVFSNGSESATQENIAGVPVDTSTDILDQPVQGTGCFYFATPQGAQALLPVSISTCADMEGKEVYDCETTMGEQIKLTKVPGLKMVSQISEGVYGIPEECGFLPLENLTNLASSPDDFLKVAEARALPTAVRVITDGSAYTFQGAPIDKLAGVIETEFLPLDDAVFLGAILGQHPTKLASDLKTMLKKGSQEIWFAAKPVTTLKEHYAQSKVAAAKFLAKLPNLKADLFKEAAPITDPSSVDKIMSLGFINSENMSIFSQYVPEFETAIRKLAELLMATRLGLQSVDEGAIQKALVHLDKVIAGLRTMESGAQA